MQIIEPTAWRAQPWRNGAGVTHELMRWPGGDPAGDPGGGSGGGPGGGSGGEPFAVRVSVADIAAPAPFSAFPGYRRWLYLLEGGPVSLDVDGEAIVLAAPGDGLAFAGEARIAAAVVARPSRDLNFMVRAELPARAELLRGGARVELAGAFVAVLAIAGAVEIEGAAAGAGAAAGRRALGRYGCAWAAGGRAALAVSLGPDALAAALVIEP